MTPRRHLLMFILWPLYLVDSAILFLARLDSEFYYVPIAIWVLGLPYLFGALMDSRTSALNPVVRRGYFMILGLGLVTVGGAMKGLAIVIFVLLRTGPSTFYNISNIASDILMFSGTLLGVGVWWKGKLGVG